MDTQVHEIAARFTVYEDGLLSNINAEYRGSRRRNAVLMEKCQAILPTIIVRGTLHPSVLRSWSSLVMRLSMGKYRRAFARLLSAIKASVRIEQLKTSS